MEHYYQNIGEDWFSYAGFYRDMVDKAIDGDIFVELGCWKGRSTCFMGVEIINSGKKIQLCAVDSWRYRPNTEQPCSSQMEFDKVYKEFLTNTKPIIDVLDVYIMDTTYAAEAFDDESVELVFFDASHYKEDLKRDIEAWFPKVRTGGIFAGHDYYTRCHPGVKEAVIECFPKYETLVSMNVWFTKKDWNK